jgi:hypothetical protein
MKASSIILRVLLSAALVFNGISSAVASARMISAAEVTPTAMAVNPRAQHGPVAPEPSQGACHESVAAPDGDAPLSGTGHGEHGTDCCQAGMCACHCMHQAQAASVPPHLASPQIAHSASVRAMSSAHETPRLPHLIRPPILQAS